MYCVIMAGGGGTRFWPLSRANKPKQFLPVGGDKSLLRQTIDRISPIIPPENILIVTAEKYAETTAQLAAELPLQNILAEPSARNTAPCIALALAEMKKRGDENEVMVVLPADHLIGLPEKFRNSIEYSARQAVDKKMLITLGIVPSRPETGYGYLKLGDKIDSENDFLVRRVARFVEKPDTKTAFEYYHSREYLWNAGMFIWSGELLLEEFKKHNPGLADSIEPMAAALAADDKQSLEKIYNGFAAGAEATSIDYGLMEKSDCVATVPVSIDWSDVGSFPSLREVMPPNEDGTVGHYKDLLSIEAINNIVHSPDKMVALIGVDDLVIVDTPEALLICHSDEAQKIKQIVELLKTEKLDEYL